MTLQEKKEDCSASNEIFRPDYERLNLNQDNDHTPDPAQFHWHWLCWITCYRAERQWASHQKFWWSLPQELHFVLPGLQMKRLEALLLPKRPTACFNKSLWTSVVQLLWCILLFTLLCCVTLCPWLGDPEQCHLLQIGQSAKSWNNSVYVLQEDSLNIIGKQTDGTHIFLLEWLHTDRLYGNNQINQRPAIMIVSLSRYASVGDLVPWQQAWSPIFGAHCNLKNFRSPFFTSCLSKWKRQVQTSHLTRLWH